MANKTQLLDLLDKHVFHPILNAGQEKFNTRQHAELQDAEERTKIRKARFYRYESAERIVAMYKDDLSSEKARPVNAHLQDLG